MKTLIFRPESMKQKQEISDYSFTDSGLNISVVIGVSSYLVCSNFRSGFFILHATCMYCPA